MKVYFKVNDIKLFFLLNISDIIDIRRLKNERFLEKNI